MGTEKMHANVWSEDLKGRETTWEFEV